SVQAAIPAFRDLAGVWSASPVPAQAMMPTEQTPATPASMANADRLEADAPSSSLADPESGKPLEQALAPPSLEDLGLDGLDELIDVIINEESVSFRINNEILFTSGQADLMPSGLEVLARLAEVLARNDYQIAVE